MTKFLDYLVIYWIAGANNNSGPVFLLTYTSVILLQNHIYHIYVLFIIQAYVRNYWTCAKSRKITN